MADEYRKHVPSEHPLSSGFGFIDKKRGEKEIDTMFDFGDTALEEEDVKVTDQGRVKPEGFLEDKKFDAFTSQAKESPKLGWDPSKKENFLKGENLSTPDPLSVHLNRSDKAAKQDMEREAPVTTDPALYASDPDHYDYPFVDTTEEFREEYGNKMFAFDKIERKAGKDDILRDY